MHSTAAVMRRVARIRKGLDLRAYIEEILLTKPAVLSRGGLQAWIFAWMQT